MTIKCKRCDDTGEIEILGDGDNFECDVIGMKACNHEHTYYDDEDEDEEDDEDDEDDEDGNFEYWIS